MKLHLIRTDKTEISTIDELTVDLKNTQNGNK